MATIADQMISDGVDVLLIVNLDSESGAAIEQKAADAGEKTIDYDRLTLNGSAAAYVSFDDVQVGQLQVRVSSTASTRRARSTGHRRAQRSADRPQRAAPRAGLQLGHPARVRVG